MKKYYYILFGILAVAAFGFSQYSNQKLEDQLVVSGKCVQGVVTETNGTLKRPKATIQFPIEDDVYEVTLSSRADIDDVVLLKYDTLNPEKVIIVKQCE